MRSDEAMMRILTTSSLLLGLVTACVIPKTVGEHDDIDSDGTDETIAPETTSTTGPDDGPSTSASTTDDPTMQGPPVECPDSPPGTCIGPNTGEFGCGKAFSRFDGDGCMRPRCGPEGECPAGRTCVDFRDYG